MVTNAKIPSSIELRYYYEEKTREKNNASLLIAGLTIATASFLGPTGTLCAGALGLTGLLFYGEYQDVPKTERPYDAEMDFLKEPLAMKEHREFVLV